jgi:molybdenum cofactor cytidylyltransferase
MSSRMGDFKALLPLGGQSIADRVVSIFQNNGVDVIMVVGWRAADLKSGMKSRNIVFVDNPYFEKGMFTSVQAGVSHLQDRYTAFFIMPVDIPLVRQETITRLLIEHEKYTDTILYPVFAGKRGHPPLLPPQLALEINTAPSDGNLGAILSTHDSTAQEVHVPDGHILFNLNTPEDYRVLQQRFETYDVPDDAECAALMDIYRMSEDVRRHCGKVKEVASKVGEALVSSGSKLDLNLVRTAALLHDIAKGRPHHDTVGGQWLRESGFGKVADIVASHVELPANLAEPSLEAKVVYLADKLVDGESQVSIEERFQTSERRFDLNDEAAQKILWRKKQAQQVQQEIERLLGFSIHRCLSR